MTPVEQGFFVYCRALGRGEEQFRIGTAMMTDVEGDRKHDTLYMMIPMKAEMASRAERVYVMVSPSERLVEIEIDWESQDKIDHQK